MTVPALPVRVTAWTRPSSVAMCRQGGVGAALGDADEEQGEPAQQHMGADATFEPVEHGPQLEGGLEVAEAAFGFEQVLVAERDVFGGQVRIRGGEQVLAVEAFLGADRGPVDLQVAGGGLAQVAAEGAVVP